MGDWSNFFLGQLTAASALAGLLFVAVSVNQARILSLGRMADRGLEALTMLFLIILVASFTLVPGQPLPLLGGEILAAATATFVGMVLLQRGYLAAVEPAHRRHSTRAARMNLAAVGLIATGGFALLATANPTALYLLPVGILLSFLGVGMNSWVLLVEINR